MTRPGLLALALVLTTAPRVASPDTGGPEGSRPDACVADAAALRAHLRDEAARAGRWNLAWRLGFGGATAAQLGLALAKWNPGGDYDARFRDTLYVGAGKSTIGTLARLVTPLRVQVPAAVSDPCADVVALRGALADAARLERKRFWTGNLGALALNVGGAIILGEEHSWSTGLAGFAIAYPIGLLSVYTMPRGSWHAWRALEGTTIVPVPIAGGGLALSVGGAF